MAFKHNADLGSAPTPSLFKEAPALSNRRQGRGTIAQFRAELAPAAAAACGAALIVTATAEVLSQDAATA